MEEGLLSVHARTVQESAVQRATKCQSNRCHVRWMTKAQGRVCVPTVMKKDSMRLHHIAQNDIQSNTMIRLFLEVFISYL